MRQPLATAKADENGQPGRRLPVFVCASLLALVWFCFAPVYAQAIDTGSLNELAQLARAGAPQLALSRMDAEQPGVSEEPVAWMAWEQERLQILASQGMYTALVERVDALPAGVDDRFRRFALGLKADAQIQLAKAVAARATLRELLWSPASDNSLEARSHWQQLVIRSYVMQGLNDDARLALLRYRQDFGDEDPHWRWLNAQVMLHTGQQEAAIRLLKEDKSPQGVFLRSTARLRVTPDNAKEN